MRHSRTLSVVQWALTVVNGTARAVARGRKSPAALAGAVDMARRSGATAEQIDFARTYPGRLRF